MRLVRFLAAALVVAAVGYLAVAGWLASSALTSIVTVGGPLAAIELQEDRPLDSNYRGDPGKAFGLSFEDASIDTELGPSPAWIVPGRNAAPGELWLVYAHGIAGRRENGFKVLSVAAELGVPSLLFAYRNDEGAPASPAGIYGFGVAEWRDLEAAVALAEARGAKRLILAGDSMGGAIIGEFLGRSPKAAMVVALALDSPALDIRKVVEGLTARMGFPLAGGVAVVARTLMGYRLPVDFSDAVTLGTVAAFAGPVFLAHGSKDGIVPIAVADELVARRVAPTTYLRTNADHIVSWQENPDLYRGLLDTFLRGVASKP